MVCSSGRYSTRCFDCAAHVDEDLGHYRLNCCGELLVCLGIAIPTEQGCCFLLSEGTMCKEGCSS